MGTDHTTDRPPGSCAVGSPASPRGRALDVATGLGRNAIFLAGAGFHVDAVDFSPVGLRIARQRARRAGVRVRWIEADFDTWQIPRARYALVVDAFYTNRKRLADLRASVKPGGVVLVETHLRSASRIRQGGHRRYGVRRGELRRWFRDWEILALEEGHFADHGTLHALSRIVARRPR